MIGSPASYGDGSALTFDDTAVPGTTSIVIDPGTVVQPYSLVFNNNVLAYSFSSGVIGGAATVTLSGTAGVVFYNANTYTGGTYLENAEVLQLGPGASLGTGALTVNAGTVDLGGNSQAVTNLNGLAGTITSSSAALVTLTVGPNAPGSFGGVLQNGSGTLALIVNGTSLLTLTGTNTYSGGTTISAGTLQLGNGITNGVVAGNISDRSVLAFNNATAQTLSGLISGGGSLAVTGPGLVVLGNVGNTYSGSTTVSGGTLLVAADTDLGTAPSVVTPAAITLNGGVLQFTATSAYETPTISGSRGITLGVSGGTISVPPGGGAFTAASESALQYRGIISGPGSLTITGGTGTNSGTAPYLIELGGVSTYGNGGGTTTVNNAVLAWSNNGGNGPNNILPTSTILNLVNNGWFNFNNAVSNQTVAGLTGDATGKVTITNGGNACILTLDTSAGQTYTFPGVIGAQTLLGKTGGNGELSLVINGSGTQVLSGSNSYTGATTITSGTLELGNVNAVQGSIVTDNAAMNGLAFAASGATYNVGGLSGSGNISLLAVSGGSLTLNVNGTSTTTTTYSGALSGAGGLSNGGGTLLLTNSNSNYTGPTTITGGALVLANTAVLTPAWSNSGSITVGNGGTFAVTAGSAAGEFNLTAVTASVLKDVGFAAGANLGLQVLDPSFSYATTLANTPSGAGPGETWRRHPGSHDHEYVQRAHDDLGRHA